MKQSDIPIVLHTMDSYSWVWNYWYHFFKKHVTTEYPIYFLSEEKEPDFVDDVIHIKTGFGEWGERLLYGFEQIPSDYVFYMQEDFWAHSPIELDDRFMKLFKEFNMDCFRIAYDSPRYESTFIDYIGHHQLRRINSDSDFVLSHQFSLWDKEFFMSNILPHEDPWVNEEIGSERLSIMNHRIFMYAYYWYNPVIKKGMLKKVGKTMIKNEENLTL